MNPAALRRLVADALGVPEASVRDVRLGPGGTGGRTGDAVVGGRQVFLKHVEESLPDLLPSEAAGLRWLTEATREGLLRVPEVLGVSASLLVLERIATGAPAVDHDERLGQGLAALHRAGATTFGAPWPGFVGPLPVPVDPAPDWPMFYGHRRLLPTGRVAADRGALPAGTLQRLERLVDRLPGILGPPEPPSRLHGDLWAGNAIVDAGGGPVLVDPAAHGGHREVDLAMMRLFGGFSPRVFAAYDEAFPLADGHAERVGLLQLHPLLVHAALFGGVYGTRARTVIDRHL